MIVLGIDPGRTSGWAVAVDHETIVASGVANNAKERRRAIDRALGDARCNQPSLRVAMEWVTAGGGTMRVAMGIGQARGRWLEAIELCAKYSERRVIKVQPQQWRAGTHGVVRPSGKRRKEREAELKSAACAYAGIKQSDEAEAACIAMFAAGQVAEVA